MKTKKRAAILLALCLCATAASCGGATGNAPTDDAQSGGATAYEFNKTDFDSDYSESTAVKISLSDEGITASDSSVSISASTVTIYGGGTYILSGTLSDGNIVVNSLDEQNVHLILSDCNITSATTAPIYIVSAARTIITLADATTNNLTDASEYVLAAGTDEPKAALYSKDDLAINGNGVLNITANCNNGIHSKDELVIVSGTYNITAVNDAIKGKDVLAIKDGTFMLSSSGDALQSDNETDAELGNIYIEGGSFAINSQLDGIQAENMLCIAGGDFDITTGGGSSNASMSGNLPNNQWGSWGNNATADEASAKALKAGSALLVYGGSFEINSSDDSVHSNGTIDIFGGSFTIKSGDDGMHADSALSVSGGNIDVLQSYEGLEGQTVSISGGIISVIASDDGINAAGGSDTLSAGRMGRDSFVSDGSVFIKISGGVVYVNAFGDGVDSNGDLKVSGGVLLVDGPTDSGNGALDYNGSATISDGIVIAAGASGMAESFTSDSTQKSIEVFTSVSQENSRITLVDSENNVILSYLPSKPYSSVVLSSPSLDECESVTAFCFGTLIGAESKNGCDIGGTLSGGTEIGSCDLSEIVNSIGTAESSQFGGGFGGGKRGF